MKQIIMNVLTDMSDSQINLASETARETVSSLISAALKAQGYNNKNKVNSYLTANLSEEEQKARETWVCSVCGENTYDVDYEYIGTCTNHLFCDLEVEMKEEIEK
jgi:homoaconitase/3-isopropylmalate dehydratase large subunit